MTWKIVSPNFIIHWFKFCVKENFINLLSAIYEFDSNWFVLEFWNAEKLRNSMQRGLNSESILFYGNEYVEFCNRYLKKISNISLCYWHIHLIKLSYVNSICFLQKKKNASKINDENDKPHKSVLCYYLLYWIMWSKVNNHINHKPKKNQIIRSDRDIDIGR